MPFSFSPPAQRHTIPASATCLGVMSEWRWKALAEYFLQLIEAVLEDN